MVVLTYFLLVLVSHAASITFNFTQIGPQNLNTGIVTKGDAYITSDGIHLTAEDPAAFDDGYSVGRASYVNSLHLWDKNSSEIASFDTIFDFVIAPITNLSDGLTFFLSEDNSVRTGGKGLGLPVDINTYTMTSPFVAVEFDTYWDRTVDPPDVEGTHVGIDINNLRSVTYQYWSGNVCQAHIKYDSVSKNFSVSVTDSGDGKIELYYIIDLTRVLPEWVIFGFTASTGPDDYFEKNIVQSWVFNSSDLGRNSTIQISVKGKSKAGQIAHIISGIFAVVAFIAAIFAFFLWRRKKKQEEETEAEVACDMEMNRDFEVGTGPRRFSYHELVQATSGFIETNKLGEGGFGGVYKGFLKDVGTYIAVKRVSKTSRQGIKEYMSEVKIISRLRHKNLVELKGWCHEKNELLLVYEFLENGSLDFHLFKEKSLLAWDKRYRIAYGLASALIYLQEDCKECILHRDIKSSNVMLDASFNAKLGDFGLAKLVDHEKDSQTTILAGTMGYMAPEFVMSGKASKESDVFSFGIVSLEIACGRRSIKNKARERERKLLEWVWDLYGTDDLLEAADPRLGSDFAQEELKRLMIVGLWCAHPHAPSRPSMRQAIQVLNFEASVPTLPSKIPVLAFCELPTSSSYVGTSSSAFNTLSSKLTTASSSSPSPSALQFHQI